ncbi:hypothetical protein AB0D08_09965 [Kitasatospora sp. NPDC048540]|uniref:hypothetical protein n=1 Tax=unclassified Kitasatospora TaxID=2633591 RepID=UPI000539A820|nr:hypothetical protein [Kitasatospora sp. MBT63]
MPEDSESSISNRIVGAEAQTVIQVGVLHGHLTVDRPAGRAPGEPQLTVTVDTEQPDSTGYTYEGGGSGPDTAVHLYVESFTAQAVILHGLRPVVVRRIARFGWWDAADLSPRRFRVGLDRAAAHYNADLRGAGPADGATPGGGATREARLERATPLDGTDFPFYVTSGAPEYLIVRPDGYRERELIEWRLELDWSCLGRRGTVTIDHGGQPFLSDGLRPYHYDRYRSPGGAAPRRAAPAAREQPGPGRIRALRDRLRRRRRTPPGPDAPGPGRP